MMLDKLGILGTLLKMFIKKGKIALIILFLILLVFGIIILFGQATGLGPLIYPFL